MNVILDTGNRSRGGLSSRHGGADKLSPCLSSSRHHQHAARPTSCAVVRVDRASFEDYWSAADLHCRVFHDEREEEVEAKRGGAAAGRQRMRPKPHHQEQPLEGPAGGSWNGKDLPAWLKIMDRIDRVATYNDQYRKGDISVEGRGTPCALLVAFEGDDVDGGGKRDLPLVNTSSSSSSTWAALFIKEAQSTPDRARLLELVLGGHSPFCPGIGQSAEDRRLLGVAFVTSAGGRIPLRTDGRRRQGIAYLSDVAVLPEARGKGVARRLVEKAHEVAKEWGCR